MENYRIFALGILLCSFFVSQKLVAQNENQFTNPPELIKPEQSNTAYSLGSRMFTGIPSVAISEGGRIWAVWYAGPTPGENADNYVVLATSGDKGNRWEEVLIIDPDRKGPVRAFDPEIWIDPDGKLWFFWAQTIGHDGSVAGVWAITTNNPDTKDPDWSEPRRLTNGIMMCKPVVLSGGEWVLPVSTWRLTDYSAKVIMSKDKGISWHEQGAVNVPREDREFDEHMIVEKKDGSLWMLVRTKYGIGESFSTDGGISWSPLNPSIIKHPSARFFIRRLISGNLLLVKHGPVGIKTGRSHLMAFISKDDGQSWSKGLLLDERKGVSYPDGQQDKDGTIYITYDYNRTKEQMILMTNFTEEDILADDYDSKIVQVYKRRKIVSVGGTETSN
ncbi:MAG: sialidase family protein [Prolixibacteraceae bacterium]|jgi:hypothetical protein|nr:sialidase family protein [Prolixibacteraceae bacterium]